MSVPVRALAIDGARTMRMNSARTRLRAVAFFLIVVGIGLTSEVVLAGPPVDGPRSVSGMVGSAPVLLHPAPTLGTSFDRVGAGDVTWVEDNGGESDRGRRESEREQSKIETDRDSFTPATTTTPRGRLIVESSYSFIQNRGVPETHSFPELLLRYGLTERLELRLGWNYEVGGEGSDASGLDVEAEGLFGDHRLHRETSINYGLKLKVTEGEGWVPGSAVILQGFTPTSGMATQTQFAGTYVFGWELPHRWKLDAAMRYVVGGENGDHFNEWAPSVVLKVPVTEKVSVHAEYFGLFTNGKAEEINHQYFSPGAHYLITPDLEVGVRVGWGLNEQTPRFFSNVGIGWRF
jgi:hypothetical protein